MRTSDEKVPFPTVEEDLVRRDACPICGGLCRPDAILGDLTYVRCQRCGLTFMQPMPSHEWYARLYEADYWEGRAQRSDTFEESARRLRKEHLRAIAYLRALRRNGALPERGTLLEVGCGTGGAGVTLADALGWDAVGVEPDGASRAVASAIGVAVDATDLETLAAQGRVFDVVLLSHVLEHVVHPQGFLDSIQRVLREDGVLLIEVPNGFTNESLHLFHPYLFTRRALTTLLSQHGLHAEVIAHGGASSRMRRHYLLAIATRSTEADVSGAKRGIRIGRAWSNAWRSGRVLRRIDRLLVERTVRADEALLDTWQGLLQRGGPMPES
jgi:2-polyprenyl-3-methyl-5-hydroxy-6-metoxy-1,4-benzoquinol methylase